MAEICPHCGRELEGPLLEIYYLCEKGCRTTFQKEEDGSLSWIPPMKIVALGLSEVAQIFSDLTKDPDQRATFHSQATQFRALSKILR